MKAFDENSREWQKFMREVRNKLVPKVRNSAITLALVPSTPDGVDVKFAVELGLMVMLDKPIIACIRPGTKIPEKLARVVDRFVEFDLDDPDNTDRLAAAIQEVLNPQS